MQYYQTSVEKIAGSDLKEVMKKASDIYDDIKRKTKRRPYIRSRYFNKEKVFLALFWGHLHDKLNHRDKLRRVKFFSAAVELIQNTKYDPVEKENPHKPSELLYRFAGKTKNGEVFFVQIKKNIGSGEKFLISVFPE